MRELRPLSVPEIETATREAGGWLVHEPTAQALAAYLSEAETRQRQLGEVPLRDRLQALHSLGGHWAKRLASGGLAALKDDLAASTGYSRALMDVEFGLVARVLDSEELMNNLEHGLLGGAGSLDGFKLIREGEYVRNMAAGPVLIVSSGNSLIPPLIPTAIALAAGNIVILKPSLQNYEGLIEIFKPLSSMGDEAAQSMARCLMVAYMGHDSGALEYLLREAPLGAVNFWGGEPARSLIGSKVSQNPWHPRYIVNGPLTGFAVVEAGARGDAAGGLALNMVLYDQQLCSSPTMAAYVGSPDEAQAFMVELAAALDRVGSGYPLEIGEGRLYTLQNVRRALTMRGSRVTSSADPANPWTLCLSEGGGRLKEVVGFFPEFNLYARRRFLEVVRVDTLEEAAALIRALPGDPAFRGVDKVQTVGAAVREGSLPGLLDLMAWAGVYRVVPLGDMYMRSSVEPYDGVSLPESFTYRVYHRSRVLGGGPG